MEFYNKQIRKLATMLVLSYASIALINASQFTDKCSEKMNEIVKKSKEIERLCAEYKSKYGKNGTAEQPNTTLRQAEVLTIQATKEILLQKAKEWQNELKEEQKQLKEQTDIDACQNYIKLLQENFINKLEKPTDSSSNGQQPETTNLARKAWNGTTLVATWPLKKAWNVTKWPFASERSGWVKYPVRVTAGSVVTGLTGQLTQLACKGGGVAVSTLNSSGRAAFTGIRNNKKLLSGLATAKNKAQWFAGSWVYPVWSWTPFAYAWNNTVQPVLSAANQHPKVSVPVTVAAGAAGGLFAAYKKGLISWENAKNLAKKAKFWQKADDNNEDSTEE